MDGEAAAQQTSPAAGPRPTRRPGLPASLRAFIRLPTALKWQRTLFALKRPYRSSAVYRWTLSGRTPSHLLRQPGDAWPGTAELGQGIIQNRFRFAGRTLANPAPFWNPIGAEGDWVAELHAFGWLRDLRVLGGDAARRRARELVGDWIARHPGPREQAWAPATTGRRIANWLGQYEFFAASADVAFCTQLLDSLARQARDLYRSLPAGLTGAELIAALKGLVYAGLCLPDGEGWLRRGLAMMEAELPRQILADGGHVERSPSMHLAVLRDLIDIRAALAAAGHDGTRSLTLAIEGMVPVLKMYQHADRTLALFNDTQEEQAVFLDMTQQRAGGRSRAHMAAPQSGFQRMQAGRTLLIVDAGQPPEAGCDTHAHAGTLSFEMSHGRDRLIVNCGAQHGDARWKEVQRATAAHSTLTLGETNSSELLPRGGLGRRPEDVICRREEGEGATWLDMRHDGYRRTHGAFHERRLYLATEGDDLRGEDTVDGAPSGTPIAIRFHLHPDVKAGLVQDGSAVLLRTPGGSGWRLRAAGAEMALEESVYLGRPDEVRRSTQVVLRARTDERRTTVKWALKREGGKT
ncbi:heparinase II/III family protein [Ferruginivarius sediminum]|uniref:Uncharacterized protein n=1 Tax=Ferruginivarius sediminum TaxID=2661937 RepID=A0A369TJQ8_9PROT|nr:heparinase II/III family protein [Ferruginivarius sediminum]RDD63136.1 hypothetical protein DRB17_05030 [Ferruginivarius sediminum]